MHEIIDRQSENGVLKNRILQEAEPLQVLQASQALAESAKSIATPSNEYAVPHVVADPQEFIYDADAPADEKFRELGKRLSPIGDLYRHPDLRSGLSLVTRGAWPQQIPIRTAGELQAAIVDRLRIAVVQDGKAKGGRIPPAELNAMLLSEVFLQQFPPLDRVITQPLFLPNWSETSPGYQDGGRTQTSLSHFSARIFHVAGVIFSFK